MELACERATGRKAERAQGRVSECAKWQAGTDDPGMESAKAEAVAGEGKAVISERFSSEDRLRRARMR